MATAARERPRRVLFTTFNLVADGTNGLWVRLSNLVRHLDRDRVVPHLFALNPTVLGDAKPGALFADVATVSMSHQIRPLPVRATALLAGSHWGICYRFPDLNAEIASLVHKWDIDLVVDVAGELIANLAEARCGAPIACDLIDSRVVSAQNAVAHAPSLGASVRARLALRASATFEREALRGTRFTIVASEADAAEVRSSSPGANVVTLPNGVDTEFYHPEASNGHSANLVFEGNMAYPPNEDAAIYMIRDILPLVHRSRPDAHVWIVGSNPSLRLRAMAGDRVTVTGFVLDVRPYVQQAAVFVSPLRLGAGIKNKVLQAWSMEAPVVATPESLSGLGADPGRELLVGATPAEFADAVVRLMSDPGAARQLGRAGRAHVVKHFAWEPRGATFTELLCPPGT